MSDEINEKNDTKVIEGESAPKEWNLQDVLPKNPEPWYKQRHLLLLNLAMIVPALSSTTNGYDGSLLNGLQSMDQWQNFFFPGGPNPTRLGSLGNGTIFGQILALPDRKSVV